MYAIDPNPPTLPKIKEMSLLSTKILFCKSSPKYQHP